ncbi:MAG TPA: Hsp20/alpha crystallin family protein [Pyrinomonadaceae bacterium]|nr:Hsp20/alpha crystallin family protein [Pyrinomonadaceae bacterium]
MAKAINRRFQFLGSSKNVKPSERLWYPAADVFRTPEGWMVKVELAGVSVEDVEIDIQGNILSISGMRKDRSCAAVGFSYHQLEITYSRFQKTLTFPASIEGATIEHNFEDGLLIIRLWSSEK